MRTVLILHFAVIILLSIFLGCKSSETSDTHSDSNVSSYEIVGKWRLEDEKGTGQTIDFLKNNTCTIENDIDLGTGKRFDCKWNVLEDGRIKVLMSQYGVEIPFLEGEIEGNSFYATITGDKEYEYIRIE